MIYIIILLLCNVLLGMDEDKKELSLSQQLTQIIQQGTLRDFKELYPKIKAESDDHTLKWAHCMCDWHSSAIKDIELMDSTPFIASIVHNLQKGIKAIPKKDRDKAIPDYIEHEKKQYDNELKEYFEKANSIVESIRLCSICPAGKSKKTILKKYTTLAQAQKKQLILDEKEKIQAIRLAIKEIYATEFEPEKEWKYDKSGNVYFIEDRQRKSEEPDIKEPDDSYETV